MRTPAFLPCPTTGYRPAYGRHIRVLRGDGDPTLSLGATPFGGDGRHGLSPGDPVLTDA